MAQFRRVETTEDASFQDAMGIYRAGFPANERHPVPTIAERLAAHRYWLFVGEEDQNVVLMALLYPVRGTAFVLLDYMATAEGFRSRGIGSAFLRHMLGLLATRSRKRQLVIEVENPACGDNREQRRRRGAFYRRLGAKVLDGVRYILPPLSGDQPTEMILMMFPAPGQDCLRGAVISELILHLYRELYRRDEGDPLLRSFVSDVPDTVNLV